EYDIYLSTRPEKYVGSLEIWERATNALKDSLQHKGLQYSVDPGEGVFYGPKIDIKVKDCLGRPWQCSTIQVDFNIPERLDVTYRGADNKDSRPIMVHRALMGSLERFFGILIEHHAGIFPLWLAPVQLCVLSISERQAEYAKSVAELFQKDGFRVELNTENEKIGYKIREAALSKIPYLCIIGDKEMADGTVNARKRNGENLGEMPLEKLKSILRDETADRR
ncbi:MAG: threonine--tRNA ligase, partial [Nitrospirae bacterium]|nr:threonine--tRNA ligase [Nitrospirota bacterium]